LLQVFNSQGDPAKTQHFRIEENSVARAEFMIGSGTSISNEL
jgi:hypothetical protein